MRVTVNGSPHELDPGATVHDAVREHAGDVADRVAVAVNGEVVRRADWATTSLSDGDRVEVVAAIQGG